MKSINREKQFEEALKNQPDRYFVERDSNGNIINFSDSDSGILWVKDENGVWHWID